MSYADDEQNKKIYFNRAYCIVRDLVFIVVISHISVHVDTSGLEEQQCQNNPIKIKLLHKNVA